MGGPQGWLQLRGIIETCRTKNFTAKIDRHFLDMTQLRSLSCSLFGNLLGKMEDGDGRGLVIELGNRDRE